MFPRASWLRAWLVFSLMMAFTGSAGAWVETVVRSHRATITVERDGKAIVRHELVMKLRGGPMKLLEIGGMGTNIEPLPDAIVRRAVEGSASQWPLIPESLEDGSLRLKIGAPRGIRGGSYLFDFAYAIDLRASRLIEPAEDGVSLSWIGPRLSSGVDSAQVTFIVPRGTSPPRLFEPRPGVDEGLAANILLGGLRRGDQADEVDLVRTHLASGEPAVWKIWVSRDALLSDTPALAEGRAPLSHGPVDGVRGTRIDRERLSLSALLACCFGLLLFFKARSVVSLGRFTDAREKPLIPLSPVGRAALGSALVGTAVWLGLGHQPTIAVALGAVAAGLGTYLLPVRRVRPRGPGQWAPLERSAIKSRTLPGGLWETRSFSGFSFCTALMAGCLFVGYRILPVSNYLALMTVALSLLIVPLFWTGGRKDFPQSPVEQAKPWHDRIQAAFGGEMAEIQLWGRQAMLVGADVAAVDEVRVRFLLHRAPAGLRAFEVAFEEAAGAHVLPSVLLRVLDDSRALACLPTDLPWRRGRTPEERVALLRPAAPTPAQLLRLLRSLVATFRAAQVGHTKRARRSSGSSDLAANLGIPSTAAPM